MLTFKPSSGTTQFSNYTGSYHIYGKRARSRGRSETGVVDKSQKNGFEVDKIHRKNYNEFIECYVLITQNYQFKLIVNKFLE